MRQITEQRLIKAFHDRLGGAIRDALADPDVIEVIVNASGQVWLDTLRHGRVQTGSKLHPAAGEAIIRLVAHHIGETVSEDRPLVAGIIPLTGERFQGVLATFGESADLHYQKTPHRHLSSR